MERPEESDDAVPPGVPAGELEGGFEGFGPAVGEEDSSWRLGPGAISRQPLGEIDLRLVVEVGAAHVEQLGGLVLDRRDDLGVAVARSSN